MTKPLHTIIPVLRSFDESKAREFYVSWLGFSVDWEHRFGENFPLYMQVHKDNMIFHITEHHGDGSPGARVYIRYDGDISRWQQELLAKDYRNYKPGLEEAPWGSLLMQVVDPAGNTLIFAQDLQA